jgi:hypothetical protein
VLVRGVLRVVVPPHLSLMADPLGLALTARDWTALGPADAEPRLVLFVLLGGPAAGGLPTCLPTGI